MNKPLGHLVRECEDLGDQQRLMIAELEGGNPEVRDRSRQQLILEFYRKVLSALDDEFRCA